MRELWVVFYNYAENEGEWWYGFRSWICSLSILKFLGWKIQFLQTYMCSFSAKSKITICKVIFQLIRTSSSNYYFSQSLKFKITRLLISPLVVHVHEFVVLERIGVLHSSSKVNMMMWVQALIRNFAAYSSVKPPTFADSIQTLILKFFKNGGLMIEFYGLFPVTVQWLETISFL